MWIRLGHDHHNKMDILLENVKELKAKMENLRVDNESIMNEYKWIMKSLVINSRIIIYLNIVLIISTNLI